jgi:Icc-related predicted phosphoesterase
LGVVRIYAVSDQHGLLDTNIPPCDLLLVAGDLCPDFLDGPAADGARQKRWFLGPYQDWLREQPARAVFATWGNHDFIDGPRAGDVSSIIVIDREIVMPAGEAPPVKIWFSPWSNAFGAWAWMKAPSQLEKHYDAIPANTDIIVSHQPPYGYGDTLDARYRTSADEDPHVGSKELLAAIDRVKPGAVICGHIHGSHGTYNRNGTAIYNVAIVDEDYRLAHGPTAITLRGVA